MNFSKEELHLIAGGLAFQIVHYNNQEKETAACRTEIEKQQHEFAKDYQRKNQQLLNKVIIEGLGINPPTKTYQSDY